MLRGIHVTGRGEASSRNGENFRIPGLNEKTLQARLRRSGNGDFAWMARWNARLFFSASGETDSQPDAKNIAPPLPKIKSKCKFSADKIFYVYCCGSYKIYISHFNARGYGIGKPVLTNRTAGQFLRLPAMGMIIDPALTGAR
ncbi:MAG: hypothetical protein IJU70_11730 [Lentisphaeria bacterium]|nr:hypothetical protein [Lentisphaeria bacterium]